MLHLSLLYSLLFWPASFVAQVCASTPSSTVAAPTPISTACGDIVNNCSTLFTATQAYECLISVPFVPAVATRFLKYYNESIQFQSTLAYLKNPPSSYQQPPVDFLQGLEQIQQNINNGLFTNQYAFEATLQSLIYSAHDTHVNLVAGILGAFTFVSPYGIVSVSTDGVQLPQVYISDDISNLDRNWQPSAISTINGENVTDYLTNFAAINAFGNLEPNTDWNALMSSSAADVQGSLSIFEGYITFYPGDTINFGFENGTETGPLPWLAVYNSPGNTGPLTTGGDFYNFFVLNLFPESYNPASPTNCDSAPTAVVTSSAPPAASSTSTSASQTTSIPTGWGDGSAYPPIADVVQDDLGDTGFTTGYFLRDISTAVLSLPTFQTFDQNSAQEFSEVVSQFLLRSKEAGMTKALIDLQQNSGGDALLAVDTFKQFFPTIDPFDGSRLRAHSTANVLGNTFTNYYSLSLNSSFYDALSASDWVATDRINAATGQNFTSWAEYFGPHLYNDDYFTTTQRENFSSAIYDQVASGGIDVYGFAARPANTSQPFAAQDIIMLTDGLCASTCALFMEMMRHDAGVKTVVIGGRPSLGPMQAPAGTRGAQDYTFSPFDGDLDADIAFAISINSTVSAAFPDISEDVYINYASLNLRDQILPNETVPLQFVYEAADCRIFYTLRNIYNYTALWHDAVNIVWHNSSLCVQGSTGYNTNSTTSDTTGPPDAHPSVAYNISGILGINGTTSDFIAGFSGEQVDGTRSTVSSPGTPCGAHGSAPYCNGGQTVCSSTAINTCGKKSFQCVKPCSNLNPSVCGTGGCNLYGKKFQRTQSVHGLSVTVKEGFCPVKTSCSVDAEVVNPNEPPLPPDVDLDTDEGGVSRDKSSLPLNSSLGSLIKAMFS